MSYMLYRNTLAILYDCPGQVFHLDMLGYHIEASTH